MRSRVMSNLTRTLLLAVIPSAFLTSSPSRAVGETEVAVGPFKSVTLHNGGRVIVRHGSEHQVRLLEGDMDYMRIEIVDGDRLEIERCPGDCPERYKPVVEVITPDVDALMVNDGGTIETRGTFPRQPDLRAAVHDGGVIDLRSMTVESVAAAVQDGGRILTTPRKSLLGSVARGGAITYWGVPTVMSSIDHGGVVARGKRADMNKPLHQLGAGAEEVVPPVPPVPPIPPSPGRGSY